MRYQEVDDDEEEEEEDYEYGNGRGRRERRPEPIPEYPFQSSSNNPINKAWLVIILSLLFCTAFYYKLSKYQSRKHKVEALSAENEKLKSSIADGTAAASSSASQTVISAGDDKEFIDSKPVVPREIPQSFDPLNLNHNQQLLADHTNDWFGAPFVLYPPKLPIVNTMDKDSNGPTKDNGYSRLGYFQYPTIVNRTIVFSSEGDLYLTRLPQDDIESNDIMPAMKLTTTIGNAIHPKLNPKLPYLLAYSATYTGVREVYLMDLRGIGAVTGAPGTPGGPALRLTYTPGGIISVIGWDQEGKSILYSARSTDANALPDVRLFRLWLSSGSTDKVNDISAQQSETIGDKDSDDVAAASKSKSGKDVHNNTNNAEFDDNNQNNDARKRELKKKERLQRHLNKLSVLSDQARRNSLGKTSVHPIIEPVPLAQATEGIYHTNKSTECIYFTRFKQSSSTKGYVGGSAESLWVYCPRENDDLAVPLTGNYNGTSKSPCVYSYEDGQDVLLFMSDRSGRSATPSTMNLWAMALPVTEASFPIRITDVACKNNGIDLSEYAIDPTAGGVILRVGADLHYIPEREVMKRLSPLFSKQQEQWNNIGALPIGVYSDFSSMQRRTIPATPEQFDVFETSFDSISVLLTGRGQTFVAPVIPDIRLMQQTAYGGTTNMPYRRYKVAPGAGGEGLTRILTVRHVPQAKSIDSGERLALVLATDPLSPTGEHAFYLIRIDNEASPSFGFASLFENDDSVNDTGLPSPILGGHLESGGSTKQGGLGSVYQESVTVSPCGSRAVWSDTDGRVVAITLPKTTAIENLDVVVLPRENEMKQPINGDEAQFAFSPGGRYLAIVHSARNQFSIISMVDLGPPSNGSIQLGRTVQATPDRFNSFSPVWGKTPKDFTAEKFTQGLNVTSKSSATALFFLSDRDIKMSDPSSPWGTRSPQPHFDGHSSIFVLPLHSLEGPSELKLINSYIKASYGGGGASEISMKRITELEMLLETMKSQVADEVLGSEHIATNTSIEFVEEALIDFGDEVDTELSFARKAYMIGTIPGGKYIRIVCQLSDDPSLVVIKKDDEGEFLEILETAEYPSDETKEVRVPTKGSFEYAGTSTDKKYLLVMIAEKLKIIPTTAAGLESIIQDTDMIKNIAHWTGIHLNVWPYLEFQQMYKDGWRMLRDYFYDSGLTELSWDDIFDRYLPLVERCSKREELDDVLRQMAGELSALHVFVYGGDYSLPNYGNNELQVMNEIASLGAVLERSIEKNGYIVVSIPETDPDFQTIDGGVPIYSPLSDRTLSLSGQLGLKQGDIIVGVNGEHILDVPDIHTLLQNKAGESTRLEVVRSLQERPIKDSNVGQSYQDECEPLIVVPISYSDTCDLFYGAWEYKTRQLATSLAAEAGFTTGYIHIQDMSGASAEDAFVRGFYPNYDKQALIIDVRNNKGGNIDSWILDVLQRKAWMYWQSRSTNETTLWNSRFAFRGHLVVLINEHTSSDGEAFARGVSELGLGKLVGKRTWGGGVWLSSDNRLVDGGIASAPEIGTYNERLGWGLGIEQMGVDPDFEVDNNPRSAFIGEDTQLTKAISILIEWIRQEPISFPIPGPKKGLNLSTQGADCSA